MDNKETYTPEESARFAREHLRVYQASIKLALGETGVMPNHETSHLRAYARDLLTAIDHYKSSVPENHRRVFEEIASRESSISFLEAECQKILG